MLVDGRPVADGRREVTGLGEGDEISVIFQDEGGTEAHSLVYLPADFPRLTETVPAAPATSPGHLLVNLSTYVGSPNFEAALDHRGVPVYVRGLGTQQNSADLRPGPDGGYTVARTRIDNPFAGVEIVQLDDRFQEVRRLRTSGLVHTDTHDAVVRPDGSRILLAYEPDAATGLTDAVIQEVGPDGQVVHTWDSGDHIDPATETTNVPGRADYAHVNAVEVMSDGDLLVSFRHFSGVYKIAWHAHDGFARGDIVWRLGGRFSDFAFPDDPEGGPCAQHTASQLPNGHILIFDNGSSALGENPSYCVDRSDPLGPTVDRPRSRVVEYALDEEQHTATVAWQFAQPPRYAYFAGSARRLPGGNTLIGWAASRQALATEVSPDGQVLWELAGERDFLSYRAWKTLVPDTLDPAVEVSTPAAGATYLRGQVVRPDFGCTDRGGSTLQTCAGSRAPLDTSTPGAHSFTVSATDGAGRRTTATRSYTVVEAAYSRADAWIRGQRRGLGRCGFLRRPRPPAPGHLDPPGRAQPGDGGAGAQHREPTGLPAGARHGREPPVPGALPVRGPRRDAGGPGRDLAQPDPGRRRLVGPHRAGDPAAAGSCRAVPHPPGHRHPRPRRAPE